MIPSARRRPGTSPSFWRAYHKAQSKIIASSTGLTATRSAERPTARELIAEYEKTKTLPSGQFVFVNQR